MNSPIIQHPAIHDEKNGIIGCLSCIEMKSKTILIEKSRQGKHDTL
ncbi:hypothetical protein HMPREF0880_04633 [Yokenella regensburgei ATCC 43003]|nr:hypothetical protein HMPREF0880_04633 [Yokenella regensburgei ATCC 43003]